MSKNGYEQGTQKVIPAVLIYVFSESAPGAKGSEVLLIRKPERVEGQWNGLGGKLEPLESPEMAASRELAEEAGIEIEASRFQSLGVLHFPNFKAAKSEDWTVFVFAAEVSERERGQVKASDEGELHWVSCEEILNELARGKLSRAFWAGDLQFLEHVLKREPFLGTLWYDGGSFVRGNVRRIG